jgi:uncharacterized membrane protein
MRGHRDLRVVAALAPLCGLIAVLLPVEVLSLLFLLPLAFFLPGYALTAAVFARQPLELPQRVLLSVGLSLSVLALGTIALNYVPGGLGAVSWTLLLVLIVLASCRSAALRRPRNRGSGEAWLRPRLSAVTAGLLLGGLLSVGAAFALTFTTTSAEHADGYTEMWLLPPTPDDAAAGGARVGVTSQEQERTGYRLRVRVGDPGEELVRRFSLEPGETRVLKLGPEPSSPGAEAVPVAAALFLQGQPGDVYRRVSGWLAEPRA